MRIAAFLTVFAVGAAISPTAAACTIQPPPVEVYWQSAPQTLRPNEVALEVVFVGDASEEEFDPERRITKDIVVITSCGRGSRYTYRVVRVLGGDYDGPMEISTSEISMIPNEFNDDQHRIVVGQVKTYDGWPPFLELRKADVPALPFPVPEIPLN